MQYSIKDNHLRSIFSLWTNWLAAIGALTLLILLDLWIPRVWQPVVAFGLELALVVAMRRETRFDYPACGLMLYVASRTLFWTGVAMVVINLLYSYGVVYRFFNPELINESMSFITVLIVSPVAFVVAWICHYRGANLAICRACIRRNGVSGERGFVGKLQSQESRYQLRIMMVLFGLLGGACWIYYVLAYINVNLNSADKFVFVWLPVLVYIAVGLHLGIRYSALWNYYSQNLEGSSQRQGRYTRVRMLIIYGDSVLLTVPDQRADLAPMERKIDTPCKVQLTYRQKVSANDGREIFTNMTHIQGLDIRFMYETQRGNCDFNTFHFLCFPTEEKKEELDRRYPLGHWMKIEELDELFVTGKFSPLLNAELYRLYKVAMAWKCYDAEGHRLYKIKHYRPTFRIRDIKDWEVDYNDPNWLYVADNNEDVPFWKLRKFWRKYFTGVID